MPRLRGFPLVVLVLAAVVALTGAAAAQDTTPRVLSVILENDINPVTADYVVGAIERGEREGYDAVVIQLDTPGGLDSAMREIIKKELGADVPVVVYVAPSGSRAASAGAFITLAADVAAMAPGTNIGSSTPIAVGGGEIPTDLRRKVVNDAAAYARDLAELHGRNGDWAEQAVRQASNLGSQEALEQNVVDVVAPDLPTLLNEIDGMTVEPKGITLNTAGAAVDEIEMSLWKRVLDTLIDPNLIVLLMSIGVLGITIEILNPGLILPGTVGVISLIIGLFGLQVLPVSWAGLLLMGLAAGFFVAEAFVPSHGALALAGAVSFVIGALMLFDPAGEGYQVSIWVALAVGGTLALVTAIVATKVIRARRAPTKTGREEMVGEVGVVRSELAPAGLVNVHGEIWKAHTDGEPLARGEYVRVDAVGEDLVLDVSRAEEPAAVVAHS
ncbi:MAG: nodulation protein NfeD [Gaiellaceae bacterium]